MPDTATPSKTVQASCPGKIMLAGEYDVIDGGPALLLAVARRARAQRCDEPQKQSHFLEVLRHLFAERNGKDSAACQAAARVRVDTSGFYEAGQKLGLGSSAATMVSATALCLEAGGEPLDPADVLALATRAHGDAQATLGARGSGADIACSVLGGCLRFQRDHTPQAVQLPADLALVFPWTGKAASTAQLVAAVSHFAQRSPREHAARTQAIREASLALLAAQRAEQAIAGLEAGGHAIQAMGHAAGVDLWLPVHTQMAERARALGGSLKPTGAGGGDLAVAAFRSNLDAEQFRLEIRALGIICPDLALDNQGVRLHP